MWLFRKFFKFIFVDDFDSDDYDLNYKRYYVYDEYERDYVPYGSKVIKVIFVHNRVLEEYKIMPGWKVKDCLSDNMIAVVVEDCKVGNWYVKVRKNRYLTENVYIDTLKEILRDKMEEFVSETQSPEAIIDILREIRNKRQGGQLWQRNSTAKQLSM